MGRWVGWGGNECTYVRTCAVGFHLVAAEDLGKGLGHLGAVGVLHAHKEELERRRGGRHGARGCWGGWPGLWGCMWVWVGGWMGGEMMGLGKGREV